MFLNYGFDKVRFIAPVKVDSRMRIKFVLSEFTDRDNGRYLMKFMEEKEF